MAKKTYQEILKENLAEFDTTKTVDVKGPMLDPILGYEGDGELPTYKDAASVLERYYFGERRKEHEISEMDYENDEGESGGKSMKHTEGPEGEEQAGTSSADTTKGSAKEKEKDIAKEGKEIAEKEMSSTDLKSKNMKDTEGPEGEEQAGTGDTYSDFKKRVVEAISAIAEQDDELHDEETETPEEEKAESEEMQKKEKEAGKEPAEHEDMKEQASGAGHVPPPALQKKMKNEDSGEEYEDEADAKGMKESDEMIEIDAEEDITEALENEIIEKLIAEMEEESEEEEEEEEEKEEDNDDDDDDGDDDDDEGLDVDKKMEEMVNRLTQGHTEGPEGEEQAGTGGDEKVIPPRKDRSNEGTGEKGVRPMDKAELADSK